MCPGLREQKWYGSKQGPGQASCAPLPPLAHPVRALGPGQTRMGAPLPIQTLSLPTRFPNPAGGGMEDTSPIAWESTCFPLHLGTIWGLGAGPPLAPYLCPGPAPSCSLLLVSEGLPLTLEPGDHPVPGSWAEAGGQRTLH